MSNMVAMVSDRWRQPRPDSKRQKHLEYIPPELARHAPTNKAYCYGWWACCGEPLSSIVSGPPGVIAWSTPVLLSTPKRTVFVSALKWYERTKKFDRSEMPPTTTYCPKLALDIRITGHEHPIDRWNKCSKLNSP